MSVKRIGRYEIEGTLGKGAMGLVYLARDPLIERQVALKTLRVDLDADHATEFRERFVREARAAGRLNHPGIVTVHDVGEDPETGLMYIAMEYVEGEDLRTVASKRQLQPSEAARICADVAIALDYAHSLGVIHRDVKPANIILTSDGSAKITDFGIARLEASNLTVDGQFIGTPNFMSPEQITGKPVDGRSDLFSLGVVLFYLLTGRRPFAGDTMHEVTLRIVQQPSPIPSTLSEDIPAALNPIVLKCLEKNPERRFQTGRELERVLAAVAGSLVDRRPDDVSATGVYRTDHETRIHAGPSGGARRPPWWHPASLIDRWREIPLPEWLHWEVEGRWAWPIIAATALALVALVAVMRSGIDRGPFVAPSVASSRNLHQASASLRLASRDLQTGHLQAADSAIRSALDQAPASPAARDLAGRIAAAIEEERTSAANQQRVAELVSEGRTLYRRASYPEAADLFREALDLDPLNEIAASFLELSDERLRSQRTANRGSTSSASAPSSTARTAAATPTPAAGIARITVTFNSPISAGRIAVTLGDESLAEVPFDFSSKGLLGVKRKGTGSVKRVILTPSGRHRIGVQLVDEQRGVLGGKSFETEMLPDSRWSLRIDQPSAGATPSFFLVQSAQ